MMLPPPARIRSGLLALLVLTAAPAACSRSPSGGGSTSTWTVPDPDRSAMQPQVSQALGKARDAVIAAPGNGMTWGRYGAVLDAHQLDTDALICYERAQRLVASEFRWPYLRANLMEQFDAPAGEIVAQYRAAASIEPDFPPTYFRIGEVLSRLGQLEAARDSYRQAIRLDPDRLPIANRSLGQVLLLLGDPPGALEQLQRADAITPNDRPTIVSMSQALLRLGRTEEAHVAAARSRSLTERIALPDPVRFGVESMKVTIDACRERAVAKAAAGDAAGALAELATLDDVETDDPYFFLQVGSAYLAIQRPDLAVFHFLHATRVRPDIPLGYAQLGVAYLALGQPADAERHLRRSLELDDTNAAAHARLGMALARQQRLDEAVSSFERAASLGSLGPEAQATWGTALLQSNNPSAAAEHFQIALDLLPTYVGAHYNLGLALEQLGRRDEAIEHYRQAARIDPNHRARQRLNELGVSP